MPSDNHFLYFVKKGTGCPIVKMPLSYPTTYESITKCSMKPSAWNEPIARSRNCARKNYCRDTCPHLLV
jgi:hypothetical protein